MDVSRSQFDEQRNPRFGRSNPERMSVAFWEWMIAGDALTPADLIPRPSDEEDDRAIGYSPYEAHTRFDVSGYDGEGPIWTFQRLGATRTFLPDGRVICVGGEHEDYYDPDFNIYNDVIVFQPTGEFEVYGYPREAFPPTDFHTATLAGDRLILIGSGGYPDERIPGTTPVFALDLSDYRMSEIKATGESPDWLFKHEAEADGDGTITIRGGEFLDMADGKQRIRRNFDEYSFDPTRNHWRRLTRRNWQQFSIRDEEDHIFIVGQRSDFAAMMDSVVAGGFETDFDPLSTIAFVSLEDLLPSLVPHERTPSDDLDCVRIVVARVPVAITVKAGSIEIVVEGEMDACLAARLAEDVRQGVEAATERRCVVD